MDEASQSRGRHPVVAVRSLSYSDTEDMLAGQVQHFQVGERASATELEWDNRSDHPSIVFDDGLTASRALAVLLLPESFWKAAVLQPLQHPHALAMRKVGVPSRIEWVSLRFNSDVPDNPSV
jgi:hypothetical protein